MSLEDALQLGLVAGLDPLGEDGDGVGRDLVLGNLPAQVFQLHLAQNDQIILLQRGAGVVEE
jgi:hypothetical protein